MRPEYTKWRQFLAWVGFITLFVIVPLCLIWAVHYINVASETIISR